MEPTSDVLNQKPDPSNPWWMPSFTNCVELADGSRYVGSAALSTDRVDLWVWLEKGIDLAGAFSIFNNPEKTSKITSYTSILTTESWEGYTALSVIKTDGTKISIRMRKPVKEE